MVQVLKYTPGKAGGKKASKPVTQFNVFRFSHDGSKCEGWNAFYLDTKPWDEVTGSLIANPWEVFIEIQPKIFLYVARLANFSYGYQHACQISATGIRSTCASKPWIMFVCIAKGPTKCKHK